MTGDQLIAMLCLLADLQRDKQALTERVAELEKQLADALAQKA